MPEPTVTSKDRPVWQHWQDTVQVKDKEGKKIKAKRWVIGHADGLYYRSFQMEEVAKDFVAILNERDEALVRLAAALGKKVEQIQPREFKKGDKVRFLKQWESRPGRDVVSNWIFPDVGEILTVEAVSTYRNGEPWILLTPGGCRVYPECLEAI